MPQDLTVLTPLPRDLRAASTLLGREEARYLVDTYYQIQEFRKATNNQARSMVDPESGEEQPHATLAFFGDQFDFLEKNIAKALDTYSAAQPMGEWARAVKGIGPVIAAGLLAHLDELPPETVGHWWSFAGLVPNIKWEKGQKRPYNARLKVLCWKIGDSFVKVSTGEKAGFYGKLYRQRKEYEVKRDESVREVPGPGWYEVPAWKDTRNPELQHVNQEAVQIGDKWFVGGCARAAAETMEKRKIQDAATRKVYLSGHLPPGRLDLRARRWAVQLFLAHYHDEAYRQAYHKEPPLPYPIAHLGHTDVIKPPHG
jgi:hypothetical protein